MNQIKNIILKYSTEIDEDTIQLTHSDLKAIEAHINREYEIIEKHKGQNTNNNYYMED